MMKAIWPLFDRASDRSCKEGTLDFDYAPTENFELRLEGRRDEPITIAGVQVIPKTYQRWFEAMYKV